MKKKSLMDQLFNKKVKDYSFTVIFFLVFSFFVVFVIRPNIITVFKSQKELQDLNKLDKDYENIIFSIINLQSKIQLNLENLPLLEQAIPKVPQVNKVIDDLASSATESGIILKSIDVSKINLKEDSDKRTTKSYMVLLEIDSDFPKVKQFLDNTLHQRRLKTIKSFSVLKEESKSSASAGLKISFEIEGYYL